MTTEIQQEHVIVNERGEYFAGYEDRPIHVEGARARLVQATWTIHKEKARVFPSARAAHRVRSRGFVRLTVVSGSEA